MNRMISTTIALLAVQAAAQSPAPLTFWYEQANPSGQRALQKNLIDPFNASQKACRLTLDVRGANLDKQLRVALLSGGGPDIVLTPGPSYIAPLAEAGRLLSLEPYAAKYGWKGKILPAAYDTGVFKNELYALPKTYESMALFYNKTLFDENGWKAPKTLQELDTLAAAMLAKNITPFAAGNADWKGANEWLVTAVLNQYAGPDNLAKALQGKLAWTDPVFVGAIDLLKSWWDKGYFGKNYLSLSLEQGFGQMAARKAGMSLNGTWAFTWAKSFTDAKQVQATAPIPALRPGVPYPLYALGIGTTLSINKNSKNPDCAAAALNMIYNTSFYQNMNRDWAGDWNVPLRTLDSALLAKNTTPLYASTIAGLASAVNKGNFGYTTWTFLPPKTDAYLISGIEQVWLSGLSSKDYLQKLNDTFQEERKAGNLPVIPVASK